MRLLVYPIIQACAVPALGQLRSACKLPEDRPGYLNGVELHSHGYIQEVRLKSHEE